MEELPLDKANRLLIARAFSDVPRVDMSIECVIEGQMGQAFVDDVNEPSVYMLRAGPFAYFAGDPDSADGRDLLQELPKGSLLMPSGPGWHEAIQAMYSGQLMTIERFSFSSKSLSEERLEQLIETAGLGQAIQPIDEALAEEVWGKDHFIHLADYQSPGDFVRRGAGFFMAREGDIVGAAYSSLVCSWGIEVSVFVQERLRQRGIGTALSAHLLLWCLERQIHPNWDAANAESCKLAEKLGYTPAGYYEAHWY